MERTIIQPAVSSVGEYDRTEIYFEGHLVSNEINEDSEEFNHTFLPRNALAVFDKVLSISRMERCEDIVGLKNNCIESINKLSFCSGRSTRDDIITEIASYCLAALIDETVLNTTWGINSDWANESVLSHFHKETWGGEKFFYFVETQLKEPLPNIALVSLLFHCLSLGFLGKYRLKKNGSDKINEYSKALYLILKAHVRNHNTSTQKLHFPVTKYELQKPFPLWIVITLFVTAATVIYSNLHYRTSALTAELTMKIPDMAVKEMGSALPTIWPTKKKSKLKELLATEISKGIVQLDIKNNATTITIFNKFLFNSGSKEIGLSMRPVISKIARLLEGESGKILITGHTDSSPITNDMYPSNWHLSLARATQVANFMSRETNLSGRLWPEGKGDSEPISSNLTKTSRAKNRRVEITIITE